MEELKTIYENIKTEIDKAKKGYRKAYEYNEKDFFAEMCFCLLTPQSKAKNAWGAIETLKANNLLYEGSPEQIAEHLNVVRFKNNKAKYIVRLREKMTIDGHLKPKQLISIEDVVETRNKLAKEISGWGMKEASHFLRNIGFGNDIAILDRHILKNLVKYGVIEVVPRSITTKLYIEIENKMKEFSKKININMEALDLVLWYKEAGEVFK